MSNKFTPTANPEILSTYKSLLDEIDFDYTVNTIKKAHIDVKMHPSTWAEYESLTKAQKRYLIVQWFRTNEGGHLTPNFKETLVGNADAYLSKQGGLLDSLEDLLKEYRVESGSTWDGPFTSIKELEPGSNKFSKNNRRILNLEGSDDISISKRNNLYKSNLREIKYATRNLAGMKATRVTRKLEALIDAKTLKTRTRLYTELLAIDTEFWGSYTRPSHLHIDSVSAGQRFTKKAVKIRHNISLLTLELNKVSHAEDISSVLSKYGSITLKEDIYVVRKEGKFDHQLKVGLRLEKNAIKPPYTIGRDSGWVNSQFVFNNDTPANRQKFANMDLSDFRYSAIDDASKEFVSVELMTKSTLNTTRRGIRGAQIISAVDVYKIPKGTRVTFVFDIINPREIQIARSVLLNTKYIDSARLAKKAIDKFSKADDVENLIHVLNRTYNEAQLDKITSQHMFDQVFDLDDIVKHAESGSIPVRKRPGSNKYTPKIESPALKTELLKFKTINVMKEGNWNKGTIFDVIEHIRDTKGVKTGKAYLDFPFTAEFKKMLKGLPRAKQDEILEQMIRSSGMKLIKNKIPATKLKGGGWQLPESPTRVTINGMENINFGQFIRTSSSRTKQQHYKRLAGYIGELLAEHKFKVAPLRAPFDLYFGWDNALKPPGWVLIPNGKKLVIGQMSAIPSEITQSKRDAKRAGNIKTKIKVISKGTPLLLPLLLKGQKITITASYMDTLLPGHSGSFKSYNMNAISNQIHGIFRAANPDDIDKVFFSLHMPVMNHDTLTIEEYILLVLEDKKADSLGKKSSIVGAHPNARKEYLEHISNFTHKDINVQKEIKLWMSTVNSDDLLHSFIGPDELKKRAIRTNKVWSKYFNKVGMSFIKTYTGNAIPVIPNILDLTRLHQTLSGTKHVKVTADMVSDKELTTLAKKSVTNLEKAMRGIGAYINSQTQALKFQDNLKLLAKHFPDDAATISKLVREFDVKHFTDKQKAIVSDIHKKVLTYSKAVRASANIAKDAAVLNINIKPGKVIDNENIRVVATRNGDNRVEIKNPKTGKWKSTTTVLSKTELDALQMKDLVVTLGNKGGKLAFKIFIGTGIGIWVTAVGASTISTENSRGKWAVYLSDPDKEHEEAYAASVLEGFKDSWLYDLWNSIEWSQLVERVSFSISHWVRINIGDVIADKINNAFTITLDIFKKTAGTAWDFWTLIFDLIADAYGLLPIGLRIKFANFLIGTLDVLIYIMTGLDIAFHVLGAIFEFIIDNPLVDAFKAGAAFDITQGMTDEEQEDVRDILQQRGVGVFY